MDTQELLNGIESKAARVQQSNEDAFSSWQNDCHQTACKVKALQPRIKELVMVAQKMIDCGIGLKVKHDTGWYFETDGIRHNIGFTFEKGSATTPFRGNFFYNGGRIKGIGIRGGGWSGNTFAVDTQGDIYLGYECKSCKASYYWTRKYTDLVELGKMKTFVNNFDKFEKEFLDFVRSAIQ